MGRRRDIAASVRRIDMTYRRARILGLRLDGLTMREIARSEGVSAATVHRDIWASIDDLNARDNPGHIRRYPSLTGPAVTIAVLKRRALADAATRH